MTTPDQRADATVRKINEPLPYQPYGRERTRVQGIISAEIRAALEERDREWRDRWNNSFYAKAEREACAKVAEGMKGPKAHKIAAAIREKP